ncbi:universal stress protein [Kribbella sp. NPDC004875]|uniref:universal stress protein n=1 Tax=Kribbella sp. NPDC004875 TaxID=3364107 RepID=UPI003675BFD3
MAVKPVIHVGVDRSWRDTGALEWALQESLLRQEPLEVVHVIDEHLRQVPGWDPELVDDAAMDLVNDVQKYLDETPGAPDCEMDLTVGPPARSLAAVAAGSRMLVVGRRGLGTFKRLLIGSTSEAVVALAAVPVVIVPEHWKPSDHTGPVLAALDGSPDNPADNPADAAEKGAVLEFAISAAAERQLPARIVHVWDIPAVFTWDMPSAASAEWAETEQRYFEDVATEWRRKYPDVTVQVEVRRGHVIDGLVTATEQNDAQLLVVGSRHHNRLASLVAGSVTRGVLHHAACPLAVVPAGA